MEFRRSWGLSPGISIAVCLAALAFTPPSADASCPNEGLRTGFASVLPDCRAYELVSPPDSNGRSPVGISAWGWSDSGSSFPIHPITSSGEGIAFATHAVPVGAIGGLSGTVDVSEASRTPHGWEITRRLSPGEDKAVFPQAGGISADHQYSFTHVGPLSGIAGTGGVLAAGGDAVYLGAPDGTFELVGLGTVNGTPLAEPLVQGNYISEGGKHVIFSTGDGPSGAVYCRVHGTACPVRRLADDAPPEGTGAVYDRAADGPTAVVSLLPSDLTPDANEDAVYQGVSADGATVAFRIGTTLYVRVPDGDDGHTLKASEANPIFGGLSADGHYLFYVTGGENGIIHRFNTETGADAEINPAAPAEMVNVSADGSHVYFISEVDIDGNGEEGKPNLYVWRGGSPALVAVVTAEDVEPGSTNALNNWTDWAVAPASQANPEPGPGADPSRTTPDGTVFVFESRAGLTDYENNNHSEVYRYEEGEPELACLSCSPQVEPAESDAHLENLTLNRPATVIHNLSADGKRVFFEAGDALVPEDIDGINDIYEWHQEPASASTINLISTGRSPKYEPLSSGFPQPTPNVIYAITPNGSDVVFLAQEELVPGAGSGGTPNLYDARVNGGFAAPEPVSNCFQEECHFQHGSQPLLAVPAPSTQGGNLKSRKQRRHCRKRSTKKRHRGCHRRHSKKRTSKAAAVATPSATELGRAASAIEAGSSETPLPSDAHPPGPDSPSQTLAVGAFDNFGIESLGAGVSTTTAGAHPEFVTEFSVTHSVQNGSVRVGARPEDISFELPSGLVGNPNAVPNCSTGDFLASRCHPDTQVGVAEVLTSLNQVVEVPIYNLKPSHPDAEIARFGFYAVWVPVFIDIKVRTESDYAVVAGVHYAPGVVPLVESRATLWGNPASSIHDGQRATPEEIPLCNKLVPCMQPDEKRASEVPVAQRKAFLSNPSACGAAAVRLSVTSYQLPGRLFQKSTPLEPGPITDCQGLPFEPSFSAQPTSHVAGAPTGLDTKLIIPQHLGEDERSSATMREAKVTLPEGMQIAAGAANWIGTCSDEQVGFHREVDAQCPDSSKLGTATITSPALSTPIQGSLYQRTPSAGHQFGLWLVADALGLHVKLPGELQPDPVTGRLSASFTDLPQVPTSEIDLNVWGGSRAPLQNPDHCGTYVTNYSFAPHSDDPAVSGQSQMTIDEGCGQGFDPSLSAGVTEPVAGKFSPLIIDLTKPDGQQNLRGFELELPDGELAKLKGVPLCPDSAAASGACPAASKIGSVTAAAGPGPEPFWVPGAGKPQPTVYLAGPYKGSPFSVVTVAPAQAGPFDLGSVVIRSGLGLNPDTNRGVIKADPLPQFFEGVGLTYRRLHVVVDRPGFSLNPTDCSRLEVSSNVSSTTGTTAHPSAPFQVGGCKRLKFKPKLSLKLTGGTKRADYPALTAVLQARKGDANIAKTSVALPHSEFLAQEHIGTICTRKQFAVDQCPKGSVYGRGKVWTPLLAKPLSGPVYLRSSNHPLPDLVVALGGELDVNLVGRIDSKNGGIRATFETVPDAPVTKFVLKMRGGKKSLFINSTDICVGKHRATVQMGAQNGRKVDLRPKLKAPKCNRR
jgi:hypothetical protein